MSCRLEFSSSDWVLYLCQCLVVILCLIVSESSEEILLFSIRASLCVSVAPCKKSVKQPGCIEHAISVCSKEVRVGFSENHYWWDMYTDCFHPFEDIFEVLICMDCSEIRVRGWIRILIGFGIWVYKGRESITVFVWGCLCVDVIYWDNSVWFSLIVEM